MKKMLFLLSLFLAGCESIFPQSKYLYDSPNGPVYEAYCNGTYKTLGDCYQKAGQICNGNFQIMNKSDRSNRNYTYVRYGETNNSTAVRNDQLSSVQRSIIFYCVR